MAFGFPANARGEGHYDVAEGQLLEAIRDTLEVLEWPYEEYDGGVFHIRRGMGLLSYGERVEITAGRGGRVHVHSKCVWPLQAIDWGKNAQNVDAFLQGLNRMLS